MRVKILWEALTDELNALVIWKKLMTPVVFLELTLETNLPCQVHLSCNLLSSIKVIYQRSLEEINSSRMSDTMYYAIRGSGPLWTLKIPYWASQN